MRLLHRFAVCAVFTFIGLIVGCRTSQRSTALLNPSRAVAQKLPQRDDKDDLSEQGLQQAAHQDDGDQGLPLKVAGTLRVPSALSLQDDDEQILDHNQSPDDPFDGTSELSLDRLITAVQNRNPSMQAARAAWSAAAERYPQAIALDDPMLQTMFAPASFASNNSQSSYYLGAAQRVPWQGKRALRGEMAKWESQAASWDAEEVKLRLAIAARMAFLDYYLVRREFELNDKNVEVMQDFRSTAKSKYEANQVSQQDLSAADLELAKLKQQQLELEQTERIAVARINTLLHRQPDHSLPPPPPRLVIDDAIPDSLELRELAKSNRPELAALGARIQSEQNAVALACKQYYPDFEFMGRYDTFWTDAQQRPQVGMNMNVPIQRGRLGAAVREAQFRVTKLMAEYAQQQDAVNEEVQIAYARVNANSKAAALYEASILPSAQTNLEAARAAYVAGSIDFLRLMEARRQFVEQQIGYQRTLTEYQRSRADLERAVGTSISK